MFSALFWLALYVILRAQGIHFFNPTGFNAAPWDVTFNTTSSFITNTNWQFYSGETTMSYLSQMAGLAVQNFVSAAVGMAVLVAMIRGFARRSADTLGNFWVDVTRSLLYILLPLSLIGALLLVSQGVVQTLAGPISFTTAIGGDQTLALGPAASQIAIKQLGTNGGGFFNVNSAMPFENPTQLANFIEVLFILLIPAGLTATFGRMVGSRRQGWTLYSAMLAMFIAGVVVAYAAEQHGSPVLPQGGHRDERRRRQHRWEPAGCRAAQRDRQLCAVGDGDDRRVERLGQLRPRGLHRHRRHGAARQHGDRGGDLRRGRLGPVRDAAVRPADRVHSRADGGAHARVPRQEGRGEGDEARRDRDHLRADRRADR